MRDSFKIAESKVHNDSVKNLMTVEVYFELKEAIEKGLVKVGDTYEHLIATIGNVPAEMLFLADGEHICGFSALGPNCNGGAGVDVDNNGIITELNCRDMTDDDKDADDTKVFSWYMKEVFAQVFGEESCPEGARYISEKGMAFAKEKNVDTTACLEYFKQYINLETMEAIGDPFAD